MLYPMGNSGYNYQPFGNPQPARTELIQVDGINGAYNYEIPANSSVAMFDQNDSLLYVKATDAGGYARVSSFRLVPEGDSTQQPQVNAVTREEFDALVATVKELKDAKQPVPTVEQPSTQPLAQQPVAVAAVAQPGTEPNQPGV